MTPQYSPVQLTVRSNDRNNMRIPRSEPDPSQDAPPMERHHPPHCHWQYSHEHSYFRHDSSHGFLVDFLVHTSHAMRGVRDVSEHILVQLIARLKHIASHS